jgi:hypothetical protein
MNRKKLCSPIVAQADYSQQLCLNLEPPRKAQISSIPGIPAKERNRYRVTFNGEILGDKLTLDEALKLAGGKH